MICTLTINPAIDRLLFIREFVRDNTNRIKQSKDVLGGKGTHVSVNLSILGCKSRAYGIGFGKLGKKIESMLKESEVEPYFLQFEEGESRMNYALIEENRSCTLITEKGREIPEEICREMLATLDETLRDGDYLVLSGDASNTSVPYIYNLIMESIEKAGKQIRFFLDTSSDNLIRGIGKKPFLVKPNMDELSQVIGRKIEKEEEILEGINQIAAYGIPCVAVSRGGEGSIVRYGSAVYQVYPLTVQVANTIGCGDAFLSGLVYGFANELPIEEILKLAAGVSAATAESKLTVGFQYERAMELREKAIVEKIR